MTGRFSIRCTSCREEYELPEDFRRGLRGKSVDCPACSGRWTPLPASGFLARLRSPKEAGLDLTPYRKAEAASFAETLPILVTAGEPREAGEPAGEAEPPEAAKRPVEPSSELVSELVSDRVSEPSAAGPEVAATGKPPTLRLVAFGPGVDVTRVHELGSRSFLIGRRACHLELPDAPIPERAIRIRAAEDGLSFEGLGGFSVPLETIQVAAGRVETGASLTFRLGPYELLVEASRLPGSSIDELEERPAEAPRADIRDQLPAAARTLTRAEDQASQTMLDLGAAVRHSETLEGVLRGFEIRLVGAEGSLRGKSFRVRKSPVLVGRTAGDLIIPHERVSSKHAQLEILGPAHFLIKDLASTNGTTVNDHPISTSSLHNGDVVGFGGVHFRFEVKTKR